MDQEFLSCVFEVDRDGQSELFSLVVRDLQAAADANQRARELVEREVCSTQLATTALIALRELERESAPSFPGYLVKTKIGSGGMGSVFRAVREGGEAKNACAIKTLHEWFLASESLKMRFAREAKTLEDLRGHIGIVNLLDKQLDCQRPFFVMELLEGLPITEYGRVHALSERPIECAELMGDVCEAVAYAHQRDVVHFDLSPRNVIVCSGRTPKIIDFGVSDSQVAGLRFGKANEVVGTPGYRSPEQLDPQLHPERWPGKESDQYALGVLLFEVVSGARFPERCRRGTKVPVLDDGELSKIVQIATHHNPRRRYGSVGDLCEALRLYTERTRRFGSSRTSPPRQKKAWRMSRRGATGLVVVGCALVLGVLAWVQRLEGYGGTPAGDTYSGGDEDEPSRAAGSVARGFEETSDVGEGVATPVMASEEGDPPSVGAEVSVARPPGGETAAPPVVGPPQRSDPKHAGRKPTSEPDEVTTPTDDERCHKVFEDTVTGGSKACDREYKRLSPECKKTSTVRELRKKCDVL